MRGRGRCARRERTGVGVSVCVCKILDCDGWIARASEDGARSVAGGDYPTHQLP